MSLLALPRKIQEAEFDDSLQHGSDTISITITESLRYHSGSGDPERYRHEYTWDQILRIIGPTLIDECSEGEMKKRLLIDAIGNSRDARLRFEIDPESFDQIKVQLKALQLIEKGTKKRTASDSAKYWRLTDRGDIHLTRLLAIRRPEAAAEPERAS